MLLEEASIVTSIRAGNIDAFVGIVEHYQVPLFRYLFRMTGDYELARDLAQETFVQAYKSILKTESTLQLKAWLYRIATNNALQHRRRKKLISFISFEDRGKSRSEAENADDTPDVLDIQQSLNAVPVEYRVCLVLHFVEGFKYVEIGLVLGISEEAVRKRVARGKQVFRRAYGGGEEV